MNDGDEVVVANAAEAFTVAERLRDESIAAGDQSYGAVVLRGDRIVGWGRSGVLTLTDPTAHAEMTAIRDAVARLERSDLSDCILVSTSHPCPMCETAAFFARITEMMHGPVLTSAGAPRRAERPSS